MSTDTFEEFFGAVNRKKSDKTKEVVNFMENSVLQIAEIVDQLDEKLTAIENSVFGIMNDLQELKNLSGTSVSAPASTSVGGGGVSVPPPPGGGGGLPPLPGLDPPPASASASSFGSPSPTPRSSPPPGSAPPSDSPMMMQANLQNELKAAFKNIRARLDDGDE